MRGFDFIGRWALWCALIGEIMIFDYAGFGIEWQVDYVGEGKRKL